MTLDEAVQYLRSRTEFATVVRDSHLGPDVEDSARRFGESGEFASLCALLGDRLKGARVLDLGAGTGIASRAFVKAGAGSVIAIEPDPSALVGRGALNRLRAAWPMIEVRGDFAEHLTIPDASVDIVYARQVLHHMRDLDGALRECARVLMPSGVFIACREHVVDNESQLKKFLAAHPVHQLAGGENAFSGAAYRHAIEQAGLELQREFGPWDSVINAFPVVTNDIELATYPRLALERRMGAIGALFAQFPGVTKLVWCWLRRRRPGRMHSYLAVKPTR